MGTSFLAVGLSLRELFTLDFKINKNLAWLMTVAVPALIFLSGTRNFVFLMGLSGGLSVTLTGILVVLSFYEAKKKGQRKPEYSLPKWKFLGGLIVLVFFAALVYSLSNIF